MQPTTSEPSSAVGAPFVGRSLPIDTDVAIVGAGAAGIAAALTARATALSFRLIEARERTGGRTWTTTTPAGQPFDQGASWIHAADRGNPFAELALAVGAAPTIDRRRRVLLDDRGQRQDAAAIAAFHASRDAAERRIAMAAPNASLADCLPVPPSAEAGPCAWNDRVFAGPWLCGMDCRDTDAADWALACQGEDWLLPDGYGTLVQALAATVPTSTNCRLEALEIRPDSVELVTSGGRFRAAHVVLTVPLGVLQAERIGFTPSLPAAHLQALDQLSMSRLMKIGLDLRTDPFGEAEGYFLHYPASDETAVLYLMQPCGKPMAYAFVGGSAAKALEKDSDHAIRDAVLAPLRRLLGSTVVERTFGEAVVTRWADDPFALGSYSVAKPGGAAARAVLAAPILGRVFLAGEATALDGWYGTAGGAWLAGRAAIAAIDRERRLA